MILVQTLYLQAPNSSVAKSSLSSAHQVIKAYRRRGGDALCC